MTFIKKLIVVFLAIASIGYSYGQQVELQTGPAVNIFRTIEELKARFPEYARLRCEYTACNAHETNTPDQMERIARELGSMSEDMKTYGEILLVYRVSLVNQDLERDPKFKQLSLVDKVKFIFPKNNLFNDILKKPVIDEEIIFVRKVMGCPEVGVLSELYRLFFMEI